MVYQRRLTPAERAFLIQAYFVSRGDVRAVRRAWRRRIDAIAANEGNDGEVVASPPPNSRTIQALVQRFLELGSVEDRPRSGRPSTVCTAHLEKRVRESVLRHPTMSLVRRAQALNVSRRSLQRVVHHRLGLRAYKFRLVQKLTEDDRRTRLEYGLAMTHLIEKLDQERRAAATTVAQNRQPLPLQYCLVMGDEAHFDVSATPVNRQNFRIWSDRQPHTMFPRLEQNKQRVTVWCGVTAHGILGPYFFEDERGRTVKVNGKLYRQMLTEYVFPTLRNDPHFRDVSDWWWQQDGATAHTARETMQLLIEHFGAQRVISRKNLHPEAIQWPARSPDLSAPDFFLWGYLKERVYQPDRDESSLTQAALRRNIRAEIARLNRQDNIERILRPVMNGAITRAKLCVTHKGDYLESLIFRS